MAILGWRGVNGSSLRRATRFCWTLAGRSGQLPGTGLEGLHGKFGPIFSTRSDPSARDFTVLFSASRILYRPYSAFVSGSLYL